MIHFEKGACGLNTGSAASLLFSVKAQTQLTGVRDAVPGASQVNHVDQIAILIPERLIILINQPAQCACFAATLALAVATALRASARHPALFSLTIQSQIAVWWPQALAVVRRLLIHGAESGQRPGGATK